MEDLGTTNLFLGVMAVVSALEALLIIGLAIGGVIVYRRTTALLNDVEGRYIAPAMGRVNGILADAKVVTETLRDETERVDSAIRHTMGRVDDTADRLRWNVRAKTSRLVGFVRGARVALETILQSRAA